MRTLTRILLLSLAAALLSSIVAAQEPVTGPDPTPTVESSIAENEEVTESPQQTDANSLPEVTSQPPEDPVSFPGGLRIQTDGTAESASSNSESSNSENNSENVEGAPQGPALDAPTESLESKESDESQESFTLPAGK